MEPKSVMFARFPFGRSEEPDAVDWLVETVVKCKADPRVMNVLHWRRDDTPITMSRNNCVEVAKAAGAHYLVMLDSDMAPDAYLSSNPRRLGKDPIARPFWDSSWDFMWNHYDRGPCMIGAPYCGPPPHENPYAFRFATYQSDHPNCDMRIVQFSREEVANRSGFEEVCCLPTGLVLIDMRVFDHPLVKPPYFNYEWTDKYEQNKASTEDCVFTRDLYVAGIPLYCNWDAWAGHWKAKCVGRPTLLTRDQIHKKFVDAAISERRDSERLMFAHGCDRPSEGLSEVPAIKAPDRFLRGQAGNGRASFEVSDLLPGGQPPGVPSPESDLAASV